MAAPKQNNFWKLRSSHGRDKIFQDPEQFRTACYEYFDAVTKNPLKEQKVFGTGTRMTVNRMRPFTLKGLYVFIGIDRKTWENYKSDERFTSTVEEMENIIYTQKFEGAAAGLLKENIIARELGLADKTDIDLNKMSDEQIDEIFNRIMKTQQSNG